MTDRVEGPGSTKYKNIVSEKCEFNNNKKILVIYFYKQYNVTKMQYNVTIQCNQITKTNEKEIKQLNDIVIIKLIGY